LSQATAKIIARRQKMRAVGRDTVESVKYNKSMNLAGQGNRPLRSEAGYAMAALLVGLAVMSVLMSMALPVWSHMAKREKEEELIWRGKQYARAVGLFQRKYANTYPPTVDILVEQKFLRKKYRDPVTNDDFQLIPAGGGSPTPGLPPGRGGGGRGAQPGQPAQPRQPRQPAQPGQAGQAGFSGAITMTAGAGGSGTTANAAGAGQLNLGIAGVVSKSKDPSIKIYNGRQKYNEWTFVYVQTAQTIGGTGGNPAAGNPLLGGPGSQFPGGRGGPMGPGGRGAPLNPGGRGPFGQPGQSPFGQPGQSPFGQPGQSPFGQPPTAPQPFGNPGQKPPPRPPGS
jgi:type II secretory pathway pseudopilin PulG